MKTRVKKILTLDFQGNEALRDMVNDDGDFKSRFFYRLVESRNVVWTRSAEIAVLELMRDRWRLERELETTKKMLEKSLTEEEFDYDIESIEDLEDAFSEPVFKKLGFRESEFNRVLDDIHLEQGERM